MSAGLKIARRKLCGFESRPVYPDGVLGRRLQQFLLRIGRQGNSAVNVARMFPAVDVIAFHSILRLFPRFSVARPLPAVLWRFGTVHRSLDTSRPALMTRAKSRIRHNPQDVTR